MASPLDKIHKIPLKTRMIAFVVVIVLLVIGYIIQFQMPMNTQITNLQKTVSDLHAKMQENENKIKKLDDLRTEVNNLQQRLVLLTQQLPPESEVSSLLRQIQGLVNQSGLDLRVWKPDSKPRLHSSGLYMEIPISLTLVGGYHNTAAFFDRVSKLTRIVNILNIRMGGAKPASDGSMDIDINCTAMTFSTVEKKVEPTPTSKKTQ
jgi:type IV pilus assembly protein PilO